MEYLVVLHTLELRTRGDAWRESGGRGRGFRAKGTQALLAGLRAPVADQRGAAARRGLRQEPAAYVGPNAAWEAGTARGLQMVHTLGIVTSGEDPQQCSAAGDVVVEAEVSHECLAEDVLGADGEGAAKVARLTELLDWAEAWIRDVVFLHPTEGALEVPDAFPDFVPGMPRGPFPDTDVVVWVTAHPEDVPGSARCLLRDQLPGGGSGRCIAGRLNISPAHIKLSDVPDEIEWGRKLVLHEMLHLLDAVLIHAPFVDEDGTPRDTSESFVLANDQVYNRTVMLVKSPKVMATAQAHFNCSEMHGFPLEDIPAGVGAHWEARLMGPEIMSYGGGSGEPYVSDLTLAFLEDSGHYRCDASAARSLYVQEVGVKEAANSSQSLEKPPKVVSEDPQGGLASLTAMRWGKGEGCSFMFGSVLGWGTPGEPFGAGYQPYVCDGFDKEVFGCTYDNRMSAACTVETYDEQYPALTSPQRSCYIDFKEAHFPMKCVDNDNGAVGGVPSQYDYFDDPGRGGYNSAMDFAPIRVGYWSCSHQSMSKGSEIEDSGAMHKVRQFLSGDTEEEMKLYGGQDHCPECRCFSSSLTDLRNMKAQREGTARFSLQRFGLCYPANCYAEDGLQFGIMFNNIAKSGRYWYSCPKEGGAVLIPGLYGTMYCPPAREFCKFETITGVKYTETSVVLEWVYLAVAVLIPLLLLVGMCCCRQAFVGACCGQTEKVYLVRKRKLKSDGVHALQNSLKALKYSNIFLTIFSLMALGLCIYCIAYPSKQLGVFSQLQLLTPVTILLVTAASTGLYGVYFRKAGKFWALLVHSYICMAGFGIFTIGSALSLSNPDKFIDYISFVRIQVTEVDDAVMVSTAKDFGAFTTFLAFLMALQSYCAVLVISPAAILESFFNFLQILFIVIAPLSAFSTYQSYGVFQYPPNLLGVAPNALSYCVSGFFFVLGLGGIKLSQVCARGDRGGGGGLSLNMMLGIYALLSVLHLFFILIALEPWANHGEFEGATEESARQQKSFATIYMVGIVVGFLLVLASLLLSTLHSQKVAHMLNSSFNSFKRTVTKRFPSQRQYRERTASQQAAWRALKERHLQMSKMPPGTGAQHIGGGYPNSAAQYPSPVVRGSSSAGGAPPPRPPPPQLQAPSPQSVAMYGAQQKGEPSGVRYPSVHNHPEILGKGEAFRKPDLYPNPLSET